MLILTMKFKILRDMHNYKKFLIHTNFSCGNISYNSLAIISIKLNIVTSPHTPSSYVTSFQHIHLVQVVSDRDNGEGPGDPTHMTPWNMSYIVVEETKQQPTHTHITFYRPCLLFSVIQTNPTCEL